jgi:molybdopterin molybdotransferase
MRPDVFGQLVSFDEALRLSLAAARPIARHEKTSLLYALDRIASADVIATLDVPSFDRSAMDGYAVRAADLPAAVPTTLRCVDRIFTGEVSGRVLQSGECIEISTGAPMPAGADAVVMVERTTRDDDAVTCTGGASAGQHIGRRGADLRAGQVIVRAGDQLTPARIGALAAAGVLTVDIFERPSIAILSTGNEVTSPGDALPPGHVYDVNRFTLRAVAEHHGCRAVLTPLVGDVLDDLIAALRAAAAQHDVVVCSGGSSVGGRDLLVDAVRALGSIAFHGVAVKPGKPTLLGWIGETPVFGMPGNPTSCLSNAYLLLMPFLRATARLPAWTPTRLTLPLATGIHSSSDRHQFFTVRIVNGGIEPAFKTSGDITSMAAADGYIEIPVSVSDLPAGTPVVVTLF